MSFSPVTNSERFSLVQGKEMGLNEIIREVEANGLIPTLTGLNRAALQDQDLAIALAAFLSSRGSVLEEKDEESLRSLSSSDFFCLQTLLCRVLEDLRLPVSEVLSFFLQLVEKGGNDMAAYRPHASLLEWLKASDQRADEVIDAARCGDELAGLVLAIALEAKGDPEEAFRSAEALDSERIAGIRALSKLELDRDRAHEAIQIALTSVNSGALPSDAVSMMQGVLQLAAMHPDLDRDEISRSMKRLSEVREEKIVHFMASALRAHFDQMTSLEVQSCANSLKYINPTNAGTIQTIDLALHQIWLSDPSYACDIASGIIAASMGKIGPSQLRMFFSDIEHGTNEQRCQVATTWLLEGNQFVCQSLSHMLSEVGCSEPCLRVSAADLPPEADKQILVCRRAVGHLFMSPMTAASFVIATLEKGDVDAINEVSDLLYDPLLLNFSGALRRWLIAVASEEPPGCPAIPRALDRIEKLLNGMSAALGVVELQPPTSHKELILFQQAESISSIQESAFSQSIFAQIATTQTILYGNESGHTTIDGSGNRTHQAIPFSEKSISMELPREEIFDPIGLQFKLMCLRAGQEGTQ